MRSLAVKTATLMFIFSFVFLGLSPLVLAEGVSDTDSDYVDYTVSGELILPSGPVSYLARGNVSESGVVSDATNVTSVTWNSTSNFWEIQLSGVGSTYYYLDFTTLVSTSGAGLTGALRSAVYDSVSGKLVVGIWESGGKVKKGFSFVVLQ